MRAIVVCLAVALAGCESQQELTNFYMQQPPLNVCHKAITSPREDIRASATAALSYRGIDCTPYLPMVSAMAANSQAQMQAGLQLMQAGRARPIQGSTGPSSCTAYNRTTYVQVVCY